MTFSYTEPPGCEIPTSIARLAVAEFQDTPGQEPWGQFVSRRLIEALERTQLPHRPAIIGPEAAEAVLQPAAEALAVVDTTSATKFGRSVNADAVVYGTVAVTRSIQRHPHVQAPECAVTVSFVIDDIQAGRTLASVSFTRRYPPDGSPPATPTVDATSPAVEAVVEELITQCVDRFVAWLCPRTVSVNEYLQVGRSRPVLEGNRLARAGHYTQALDCYLRALRESPGDDGAMFNAGLMHEALGRLDKARQFYDRARLMRPNEQVDQAVRRLEDRERSR